MMSAVRRNIRSRVKKEVNWSHVEEYGFVEDPMMHRTCDLFPSPDGGPAPLREQLTVRMSQSIQE